MLVIVLLVNTSVGYRLKLFITIGSEGVMLLLVYCCSSFFELILWRSVEPTFSFQCFFSMEIKCCGCGCRKKLIFLLFSFKTLKDNSFQYFGNFCSHETWKILEPLNNFTWEVLVIWNGNACVHDAMVYSLASFVVWACNGASWF